MDKSFAPKAKYLQHPDTGDQERHITEKTHAKLLAKCMLNPNIVGVCSAQAFQTSCVSSAWGFHPCNSPYAAGELSNV